MKTLEIHRDRFGEYSVKNENINRKLKSFTNKSDAIEYSKQKGATDIEFFNYQGININNINNIDKRTINKYDNKNCPKCGVEYSNDNPLFSIEIQGEYDGTSYYHCGSCKTYWSAFTKLEIIDIEDKTEINNVHKRF